MQTKLNFIFHFRFNLLSKFVILLLCFPFTQPLLAQQDKEKEDLGNKEYVIIKDYKPVLAESNKISDSPEGDTTVSTPVPMNYKIESRKAETGFETASIKAVKVKDETISKLYRDLVRLGIGNYTTYNGELYVNSLRSKKGALGLAVKHFSGSPALNDVGDADFSHNSAALDGKYFFTNSTFNGGVNYNRDVYHYYGFNTQDTIIAKDDTKQRFNNFGFSAGISSNYKTAGHLDYAAQFGFSTISDMFDVTENDFRVSGSGGKQVNNYYIGLDASFDYFKKTDANYQVLSLSSNLRRNIINFAPSVYFNKDKAKIKLGFRIAMEKNLDTDVRLFPTIDVSLPIAENILTVFAVVDGNIRKNSFKTLTDENPFLTSSIVPENTIHKLILEGGVRGNFSSTISFMAKVRYTKMKDLVLYLRDTVYFNKFTILYDDANVLNLHAEIGYRAGEKLGLSLHVDQYNYNMDLQPEAWQLPSSEAALIAKYDLRDKIYLNAGLFLRGKYAAAIAVPGGLEKEEVKGYADFNLGVEYKYSKILCIFLNLNNLGFSRYMRWHEYPSERFNMLGGLSYSF